MRANGVPRRAALMGQVQTDLAMALHTLPELIKNLSEALTYIARLEAAVTFYAAAPTWGNDGVARHPASHEEDRGETARAALLRHLNAFVPFVVIPFIAAHWVA